MVDPDARPGFTLERVALRFAQLLNAALAGGYGAADLDRFAADTSDTPVGTIRRQTAMRHRDWLSANESRLQMRRQWERFFDPDDGGFDVLLCPVMPCTAVGHDHTKRHIVTTDATVRQVLSDLKVRLGKHDRLSPKLKQLVENHMKIVVKRVTIRHPAASRVAHQA